MRVKIPSGRDLPIYSNCSVLDQRRGEFIVNFALMEGYQQSQEPEATMVAKVVMTPDTFKKFVESMHKSLEEYEQRFGRIQNGDH